ncbi:5'-3' exoribonuclease 1 [Cylas formicarius]|uniref:5'-3' exoribonuclease 1 n=1 Tax=Cylas formicarius TaxID=197179 RepID=UPI002958AF39|nr:5'-3' exoribonuclease 1 [Cylas formicarius]
MGVPKFFRYISERYPCLSEIVREYQIPEFDNMYLDMNGIIHMCSHPDDNNPHFRITEEKIFEDIFHYIEVLFRMIRPRKLFFMAIDGVAPRAKMNQQRSRRFRVAKDAIKQEQEAKERGEDLPTQTRFDSNCITPGTVFMAKLHEQLKYFVVRKISNDPLWRNCKVVLSGHETPGEGEHKIMDYIRYMRSLPGYDPNTRHCLYGLDADLIMLGLCTHEPHFCLLREEVKFGRKSTKRQSVPEEITFFLLHLSLMREYLEMEFAPVKDKLVGFEYDFEKIIDDWVLMGFLVGNDFIPNLPNLHIANGALPVLYKAYMDVLPTLDGYINESGTLNLERFEKYMQKLGSIELETFVELRDDLLYMEAKTGRKLCLGGEIAIRDHERSKDSGLSALIKETEELHIEPSEDEEDMAFQYYKNDYYRNKLEYKNVTPEVMRTQAEGYVRAIQWNLNYYYNGVCSWSWYYPHHYAPYITDIKGFSDVKFEFDLGTPFRPYEQLLGVLPAASKQHLPQAYHNLMTDEESPLHKYYPEDFKTDLNGKRQEWEAVVLIPFMDERVLLEAMTPCNELLTEEEKRRNTHGPMLVYTYTDKDLGPYEAPDYFPTVKHSHSELQCFSVDDIRVPKEKLIKGAYPGANMDVYYPGFPTMKHLKYEGQLQRAKVKVFEQPSRNESMIVNIISDGGDDIPWELLGNIVWVGWPHLLEAKVSAIFNSKIKYICMGERNQYNVEDLNNPSLFAAEYREIVDRYNNRLGITFGEVKVLVQVQVMTGRKYVFSHNGRVTLEKQFSENTANYPLQTVVSNITAYDSHPSAFRDIFDVFPEGCSCFTLSNPYYGSQGVVLNSKETIKSGRLKVLVSVKEEPNFVAATVLQGELFRNYKALHNVASPLGMSNILFSRVTGSIFVNTRNNEGELKSVNIGLDLKFNKKNKETPGYTRKIGSTWYYTDKVADLVKEYAEKFPAVFDFISQNDSYDNAMADSIFGKNSEDKIKEIQTWLKTLPIYGLERRPCGRQVAEPEVIQIIEETLDRPTKKLVSKKVTMQIKPPLLYQPEIQIGNLVPDPKMKVRLFDRIVNVRSGYSVPLGLKGIVVGIWESPDGNDRDTIYDVVFDEVFKDGLTLNCSPGRGYRVPRNSFINISYGQRLLEQKTGKTGGVNFLSDTTGKGYKDGRPSAQRPQSYRQSFDQLAPKQILTHGQNSYQNFAQTQQYASPTSFNQSNSAFAMFSTQKQQSWRSPENQKAGANPQQPIKSDKKFVNGGHSSSFQKRDAGTDFMPSFAKKVLTNSDKPADEIDVRDTQPNKQDKVVDENTNVLKNILKINNDENETAPPQKGQQGVTSEKSKVKEQHSPNVSFEMLAAQVAQVPASVRLMTYYESNGLGLPRYQYLLTDNAFRAQITLPNSEMILGKPAYTKEEATENVASQVLHILISKAALKEHNLQPKDAFPIPPKTWVEQENKSAKGKSPAMKTQFVPLQAIKNQRGKGAATSHEKKSKSSEDHKNKGSKNEAPAETKSAENVEKKIKGPNKGRPKSQRKPRIAANFANKKLA